MLNLALMLLALSVALEGLSVASFSRSIPASKLLLLCATAVIAGGALASASTGTRGWASWAFLFACGAFGCSAIALRNLFSRPERWVHRFVIYAGYAATLASMAAAALWLQLRSSSGRAAIVVFAAVYVLGSMCVFIAKSLTVKFAVKNIPGYSGW
ncbi:MAG TPA: hypothetical protein VF214_06200 [Edaphobacter sp.]